MCEEAVWPVIHEEEITVGDRFFPVRYVALPKHVRPGCYDHGEAAIYIQYNLHSADRKAAILHELDELILHEFKQPALDRLMQEP